MSLHWRMPPCPGSGAGVAPRSSEPPGNRFADGLDDRWADCIPNAPVEGPCPLVLALDNLKAAYTYAVSEDGGRMSEVREVEGGK
jgi:hypothetical protein